MEEHGFIRASGAFKRFGFSRGGQGVKVEAGMRTGIRVVRRVFDEPRTHRILVYVVSMAFAVRFVPYAVVSKSSLPNLALDAKLLGTTMREPALDELHSSFHRNLDVRREDKVHMIGHDNKFVQEKPALAAIRKESVQKQFAQPRGAEQGLSVMGYRC